MGLLLRILITAALVMLISNFLPGVTVESYLQSIYVAIILGLLNLFIKPIIVLFTLPVTILTLGLFLLVINAFIVLICSSIVGGFEVESFWTALFFSIILSIFQSVVYKLTAGEDK
ncbi:phage holin family protein [Flavobacterium azooxidireducens]|uniref:Phage holin family protein n=1 Tax=Flavobacterium azooxidireducens TaxID=1871076 RepID=A0ABY4KGY0_9FLAO|nr:phage holin family protein [Flavobacterium azooxidireducens]UPQ80076.1 phage holin family protein [Flavobacterium azooxidireducens]